MKRNLIIAGGTGFLGSQLIRKAVANGFKLTSISRSCPKNAINKVTYLHCDLNDYKSTETAFKKIGKPCHGAFYCVGELFGLSTKPLISKLYEMMSPIFIKNSKVIPKDFVMQSDFESKNYRGAVNFAKAVLERNGTNKFVSNIPYIYVSAHFYPLMWLLNKEYYRTKAKAEEELSSNSKLNFVSVKPGLILGKTKSLDSIIKVLPFEKIERDCLTDFMLKLMEEKIVSPVTFENSEMNNC